jgi:futalosine hydrolase
MLTQRIAAKVTHRAGVSQKMRTLLFPMKILLVAATAGEISATSQWITERAEAGLAVPDVLISGVGMLATTFSLTRRLCKEKYDLVIGAGVAGAFDLTLNLGECVLVNEEQLGDLGAEDHDQFLDVFSLGLDHPDADPFSNGRLLAPHVALPVNIDRLRRVRGLTVQHVSGNAKTIASRKARYGAQIESMEGAALHYVCLQMKVPFIQIRSISNYVTPRDRDAWEMGAALAALNGHLNELLRGLR